MSEELRRLDAAIHQDLHARMLAHFEELFGRVEKLEDRLEKVIDLLVLGKDLARAENTVESSRKPR